MPKTIFKNLTFYFILLAYVGLLLLYNIFISVKNSNIYGLSPIIIQGFLLLSILRKAKYAKLLILIWSIVFTLTGPALEIIGSLIGNFDRTFSSANLPSLIWELISIIIAILIVSYTQSTVLIELEPIVD